MVWGEGNTKKGDQTKLQVWTIYDVLIFPLRYFLNKLSLPTATLLEFISKLVKMKVNSFFKMLCFTLKTLAEFMLYIKVSYLCLAVFLCFLNREGI